MPIDIDHVLTDRARTVREVEGARIEFETQGYTVRSDWFPARITIPDGKERWLGFRSELENSYTFIARLLDFNGAPVDIQGTDDLEVEEGLFGGGYGPTKSYKIIGTVRKPRNIEPEELLYVMMLQTKEDL